MNNVTYFVTFFNSLPDSKEIVLLMFLIKNDVFILHEYVFPKNKEFICLCLEFPTNWNEQKEDYLKKKETKKNQSAKRFQYMSRERVISQHCLNTLDTKAC